MPNIQALQGTEDQAHFDLLSTFAYETYAVYKAQRGKLPELNETQLKKLKQLSIISLSQKTKVVPYSKLQQELDIDDVRELEDLIIEVIYAGLIRGKLDQRAAHLEVKFAIGRDIKPQEFDAMMEKLSNWCQCSETLLNAVGEKMDFAQNAYNKEKERASQLENKINEVKTNLKTQMDAEATPGASMSSDMDIDGELSHRRGGRGKTRMGMFDRGSRHK